MNALTCPLCGHIDQVQSVATVYAAGTGVHAGTITGMAAGGFGAVPALLGLHGHTVGTQASGLAVAVAPPPAPGAPRRLPGTGETVVAALFGLPGIAVTWITLDFQPDIDQPSSRALLQALALMRVAIAVFILLLGQIRLFRRRKAYRVYRRIWPAASRAWRQAMVCLRCHLAFFPDGTPVHSGGAHGVIPLGRFRSTVLDIGAATTE